MRQEFSAKTKLARWQHAKGHCECCGRKLYTGDIAYDFDHDTPDGLGGDISFANCRVLCRGCHRSKTRQDVRTIAKAKRVERAHLGIKKPSRFACSRNSKFKKKLDGTVVLRSDILNAG